MKSHTCHAKRSYATCEIPKVTTVAELAIGTAIYRPRANGCGLLQTVANGCERLRTVANGCERLRTVANGCATSSEHTLNPQTPRMTREPLSYAFGNNDTGILFLFMDTIHPAVFPAGCFNTYFELITWNHTQTNARNPTLVFPPYCLLVALWNLTVRYGHRPFSSMIFQTR